MSDEIAAARANLKKNKVDGSVPTPSQNDTFIAKKGPAQAAGDVRKESRLASNGLDRETEDKNAVSDAHDFANLRAGLKKTGSSPAVKKDTKIEKEGRLANNGLDREAEDKNAVSDAHDFANLRAGLKKAGSGDKKTSEAKLEAARARTGHDPSEVKVSNQMFVSKKQAPQAAGDVRKEKDGRLTENGMNRVAEDKNAIGDEHNFANLRAGLRKTA
eukprot:TRINITY_DN655_c0_g2_i3.p1 TRINITY_DN655_c0_g2~~TRINITY_DN655_c0_g2_i3.p1  ORF type:complete len:216 (+),score=77.17 TRINITY_DN655_c0_g2_i3:60-707(+)